MAYDGQTFIEFAHFFVRAKNLKALFLKQGTYIKNSTSENSKDTAILRPVEDKSVL